MVTVTTDKLARLGTFKVNVYRYDKLIHVEDKGTHLALHYSRPPLPWRDFWRFLFNKPLFVDQTIYGYAGEAPEAIRKLGIRFVNKAAGLNWYVRV